MNQDVSYACNTESGCKTSIVLSGLPKDISYKVVNLARIAYVIKVVTRTYPLSLCYITFAHSISRDQKHLVKLAAKNISKRPHIFFPKTSKGKLLIHYKLSFQHNELVLVDINKVCILLVKRFIEPQRP